MEFISFMYMYMYVYICFLLGLFHSDIVLVASCLKALRSVYSIDNISPRLLDQVKT